MIVESPKELRSFNIPKQEAKESRTYYLYFLWYDEVLVYIGQTVSLPSRIVNHKVDKYFNKVTYKAFEHTTKEQILKIETANIKHFSPPYNNNTGGIAKTPEMALVRGDRIYERFKLHTTVLGGTYYDGKILHSILAKWNASKVKYYKLGYYEDGLLVKDFGFVSLENKTLLVSLLNNRLKYEIIEDQNTLDKLVFKRGKYKGQMYSRVLKKDKPYIKWMKENVSNYEKTMLSLK
jgi:hypothetical protein